jgi:hypothetical protein
MEFPIGIQDQGSASANEAAVLASTLALAEEFEAAVSDTNVVRIRELNDSLRRTFDAARAHNPPRGRILVRELLRPPAR